MKRLLLSLLAVVTCGVSFAETPVVIDTTPYPTIGNPEAPVSVVAFIEPKCPDTKRYNNANFPKLKAEYIDTDKIRYSVVTTSFLSQSMPAAIALLCVYHQDPSKPNAELFFKFLDYIYQVQPPERDNWATTETLQNFAGKASADIDQAQLKSCIEARHYRLEVEKNTQFGNKIMGHLSTPTIYVDGIRVENRDETIDYAKLKVAIDKALQEKKAL